MTHDDCGLWFAQLEDVFSSLGITSQTNKFAALTTLLTEEEAYVVRDLTLLGRERPADVFEVSFQFGAFHFGVRQFDACQFGASEKYRHVLVVTPLT